ncbi:MAG: FAD-binding protein [Clostridia bacterium]|nr:FAD-binding protein [Clostridia bacterium]
MKIVVCVRQGTDGLINPFDACAYEAALSINNAEVILLSMGPASTQPFLTEMTRLGASRAILLSDPQFAGSDTLATAYILALAVGELQPDLVICGRQTLVGDTGQVGPMLSALLLYPLIANVMRVVSTEGELVCETRSQGMQTAAYPALMTIERINRLRLPSIRSKTKSVEIWDHVRLSAQPERCGLHGSPTRVLETYQNDAGRRKCRFIEPSELETTIAEARQKDRHPVVASIQNRQGLKNVWIIGEEPREMASSVSDDICLIPRDTAEHLAQRIREGRPSAVLWASDAWSKSTAAQTAALLQIGLCADCTALETDGATLFMYRPAFSGSLIAKIRCLTTPAMATVRTTQKDDSDVVLAVGYGARNHFSALEKWGSAIGAAMASSRKAVDNDLMPYDTQVGLTGKTLAPAVYIAVGVSGAVHHLVGMRNAGTVIAINPDKDAPIFEYADYGIVAEVESVIS